MSLEQLPSGRWVAWGGSAVAGGATPAEALSSLRRLLDDNPTIPDEVIAAGQAIAAELGLGKAQRPLGTIRREPAFEPAMRESHPDARRVDEVLEADG